MAQIQKKPAQKSASGAAAPLWTTRVEKFARRLGRQLKEIFAGLRSSDPPTRRMSAFFFLSLFGLVSVLAISLYHYQESRRAGGHVEAEAARNFGEFIKKQAEEARHKASLIEIGSFTVELRSSGPRNIPGVVNMAELEITLECDSKQTRDLVEQSHAKIRSAVTNALTAMERSELMSRDGKKRLKKSIIDRVNEILPHGKVEDAHFTKLIMT